MGCHYELLCLAMCVVIFLKLERQLPKQKSNPILLPVKILRSMLNITSRLHRISIIPTNPINDQIF